jgi:hypothetical protein
MRQLACALLALVAVGCTRPSPPAPPPPQERFIHAVTPLLAGTEPPAGGEDRALEDLLKWLQAPPPRGPSAEFLVLTGDFGIAAAAAKLPAGTVNAEWETKQADRIATVLRTSPGNLLVYVVPGSATPSTPDVKDSLARAQRILTAVAKSLEASPVMLRDLSACYTNDAVPCEARVPGTTIRLIGYPGYLSRTNAAKGLAAATPQTLATQTAWIKKLEGAVPPSARNLKTIVVSPLTAPLPAYWATDEQATGVAKLLLQHSVAGVAIHGVGNNRFVFEPGERIDTNADRAAAQLGTLPDLERRMLLTPPLVAAPQMGREPVQGVSVIGVSDAGVRRQVQWYDAVAAPFAPSASAQAEPTARTEQPQAPTTPSTCNGIRWECFPGGVLKRAYYDIGPKEGLQRALLFSIALLAAFLTVVAIWNIPPGATDLGPPPIPTPDNKPAPAITHEQLRDTFLSTRLSRTVISGFAGLAAANLATGSTLGGSGATGANTSAFYIVWFVTFFLTLLFASAVVRGWLEALRSVIFLIPEAPIAIRKTNAEDRKGPETTSVRPIGQSVKFIWKRFRVWRLTFFDAFLNVLQGKNDMQSALWSATIVNMQENTVLAADRIRESIRTAVVQILKENKSNAEEAVNAVRVAISVLSADGKRVYYISWPADSLNREFGTNSIAWVVAMGGQARWWKDDKTIYPPELPLFKKEDGTLPDVQLPIKLIEFFENRDPDYKSFIVIPVPFRRRGEARPRGRGAIHISLLNTGDLDQLFADDAKLDDTPFKAAPNVLAKAKPQLKAALNQGITVLAELLRDFNEVVYLRDIKPKRRI